VELFRSTVRTSGGKGLEAGSQAQLASVGHYLIIIIIIIIINAHTYKTFMCQALF
jgi:hypothetical protein